MACREHTPKQQAQEAQKVQEAEHVQLEREQERAWEICREYAENTRRIELAQTAIRKGVRAGKSPYQLLVAACECIGNLTNNPGLCPLGEGGY